MNIELTVAIFGLVGAFIGALISVIGQYFFDYLKEKRHTRQYLRRINIKVYKYLEIISNTISMLINYTEIDIEKAEEYELDEFINSVYSFTKNASSVWPKLKIILYMHIPSVVNNIRFNTLERVMSIIKCDYYGSKLDKFAKPDKEMLILRKKQFSIQKQELSVAKEYLKLIEKEYMKLIK